MSGRHRPSKATPKDGTHVLSLCAAPGQLDYLVTLVFQQPSSSPLCIGVRVDVAM